MSRISQVFQVEIPLRALFERPTVAALADLITEKRSAAAAPTDLSSLLAELESLPDDEISRCTVEERNSSKENLKDAQ
jgi:hypothetical protein